MVGINISSTGLIINIQQHFSKFDPWFPWWFAIIIVLAICALITGGWLIEMITQLKRYRPIKQE